MLEEEDGEAVQAGYWWRLAAAQGHAHAKDLQSVSK